MKDSILKLNSQTADEILKELVELERDVKPKQKRIDEIKKWCKGIGSFYTLNYVCAIKEQERRCLVGLEKAQDLVGMGFLEESGLLQVSKYEIVQVAERDDLD